MNRIVIVGDDGINSLGILRSLGERKIYADVILTLDEKNKTTIFKSKYIGKKITVKKSSELLLDTLLNYAGNQNNIYLFPTSDFVLKVLSDNDKILRKYFIFPSITANIGNFTDIMSKKLMADFAEKAGFDIPKMKKYQITQNSCDDMELLSYFCGCYPLILKSDGICDSECDFIIVRSEDDLKNNLKQHIDDAIIIQSYIEDAEELAVQGISFGEKYEPVVFGAIHKKRTSLFAMGTTTYADLRIISDGCLKKCCENFAKNLEFDGIYDLDVLVKNGKYYFIECNFRNGSNGYAYTKFGANLPYLWIKGKESDNKNFDALSLCKLKNVTFVNDIGDFAYVVKRKINPLKWLYQYITADVRLIFNIKDLEPFFGIIDIRRILCSLKK